MNRNFKEYKTTDGCYLIDLNSVVTVFSADETEQEFPSVVVIFDNFNRLEIRAIPQEDIDALYNEIKNDLVNGI